MANNNLGNAINGLVEESAVEPKPKGHNELYLDALNKQYGKPDDEHAVRDAGLVWHNSDGDFYNRNMDFLTQQYTKRVAKPDFDPIKFGKIIENQIDQRMTYPNDFSQWYNKKILSPRDRRYVAAQIYDTVMDNYDFQQRELAKKK